MRQLKTIDQWERRMTGHVIYIQRIKLVKGLFEHLTMSRRFCDIDFKEVVIWSLIVRSYSCDWRCGRISRWTGFREETPVVRRTSFPSTVVEDRSWTCDVVHVKDRFQVAIYEPVEVDDDASIFGRQRISDPECIFVRWTLLASRSKHRLHALLMAWD